MRTRSLDGNSRTCSPTTSRRRFGARSITGHPVDGSDFGCSRNRCVTAGRRLRRATFDPDRTLCVVRDRRGSRGAALSSIRRALVALRRPRRRRPFGRRHHGCRPELALAVAVWYRAEDDRFRPATVAAAGAHRWRQALARAATDRSRREPAVRCSRERAIAQADDDGAADHQETGGLTVYERADLAGLLGRAGLRAERVLAVPVANRAVVLATSTEPMAFDGLGVGPDRCGVGRRDRRPRVTRACRRPPGVLARARPPRSRRRADGTGVGRGAVDTGGRHARGGRATALVKRSYPWTRSESAGEIGLAWVGHADDGRKRVVPSTWVGRDGEFLESTTVPLRLMSVRRRKPRPRRARRSSSTTSRSIGASRRPRTSRGDGGSSSEDSGPRSAWRSPLTGSDTER